MDIICYSHLRWDFVYQRPQHLLGRMAKHFRVFYVEEPIYDTLDAFLATHETDEAVLVIVPHLQAGLNETDSSASQNSLMKEFFDSRGCTEFIAWYYTPMPIELNPLMVPVLIVYDCMDELSAFKNAPSLLKEREAALLRKADIVFTGGYSLYESKKDKHSQVYLFPSSIERRHFEKARSLNTEMSDQQNIPSPRIGFFGVIDERMNIDLLGEMADKKADWHFIIIGPVVKIDPATLPRQSNIHYLGSKTYKELPYYISRWNVAMMPFAINESTRFISPTKTPEYLAAGKPVVSTPVHDVVKSYGDTGLVAIADTSDQFIAAIQQSLDMKDVAAWRTAVDAALAENSWDSTVEKMMFYMNTSIEKKKQNSKTQKQDEYV